MRPTTEELKRELATRFGFSDFRSGQRGLVEAILAGRDALGVLPTGGGKSLCYMLPAAILDGVTVVVSPLISLMDDQVSRARRAGLRAEALHAARTRIDRERITRDLERGTLDLLLVAPERFQLSHFRASFNRAPVALFVIDEAHCAAEWGFDFRPAYLSLGGIRSALGTPCLALTATATPHVRDELVSMLKLRSPLRYVASFDRPNLSWSVVQIRSERARWQIALRMMQRTARSSRSAILYAPTRRLVELLRDRLAGAGLRVDAYHGGMRSEGRSRAQASFLEGDTRLMVATNAFGMGVDKADVSLVVHWQLPGSLEAYYQEAGRAGRDGTPSKCVALRGRGDTTLPRAFLDRSRPPTHLLRKVLDRLSRRAEAGRLRIGARDLAGHLGRSWTEEGASAAVLALAGAGLVRIHRGSVGSLEAHDVDRSEWELSLRPGRPDLARARRLRLEGLGRLRSVQRYATARSCRLGVLLGYFGEKDLPNRCGRCDGCQGNRAFRLPVPTKVGRSGDETTT